MNIRRVLKKLLDFAKDFKIISIKLFSSKNQKEYLKYFFKNAETGDSLILADYSQNEDVESVSFEYSKNKITIAVKYIGIEKRFRPDEIIIPIFRNEKKYQIEYLADGLYLKKGTKLKLVYGDRWDSGQDTPYGLIIKSNIRKQIVFVFIEDED